MTAPTNVDKPTTPDAAVRRLLEVCRKILPDIKNNFVPNDLYMEFYRMVEEAESELPAPKLPELQFEITDMGIDGIFMRAFIAGYHVWVEKDKGHALMSVGEGEQAADAIAKKLNHVAVFPKEVKDGSS